MLNKFDRYTAAKLQQGEFAVQLLGDENPDILIAQEKAAQTQALLMAKDVLLRESIPDTKARNDALFKSTLNNPETLRTELEADFPAKITDEALAKYREIVDSGAGLSETFPSVPAYGILFGKFIDRNLSDGILRISVGLRIVNLLENQALEYPRANANPKFDSPALLAASDKLNDLREKRGAEAFPKTEEQKKPYIDEAVSVLNEGVEKVATAYPEIAKALDLALVESIEGYVTPKKGELPEQNSNKNTPEGPGH